MKSLVDSPSREDLLKALDSEITDRETEMSRLGLSNWGLIGALVGVLWMTVNEFLDNRHNTTETLLVFLTGFVAIGVLRLAFGDIASIRSAYSAPGATRR